MLEGVEDGLFRDFVEYDAPRCGGVEPEHLGQVPGNGLSLAVFIGREPYGLGLRRGLTEAVDNLLLFVGNFVNRRKISVYVDAEALGFQVADMPVAGHDLEVRPKEFLDSFCLRGRFDNDKIFHHKYINYWE